MGRAINLSGFTNLNEIVGKPIKKAFGSAGEGEKWITINGRHILINGESGDVIMGGKGMSGDGSDIKRISGPMTGGEPERRTKKEKMLENQLKKIKVEEIGIKKKQKFCKKQKMRD